MKLRTLVFCDDLWHPAVTVRAGLATLCAGEFEFEFAADAAACAVGRLQEFDLAVLARANITADMKPWLKSEAEHGFVEFVQRGGGLLVIHAGTSRYENLPALNALIGSPFVHHPDPCAVIFEPQAGHFLTRGLKAFTTQDEHYFVRMEDRRAEVFLQSNSIHGAQPAGWARTEGEGRVCILTPGHNLEVWRHSEFKKLLLNALRWTAKTN
jgi:type 1 glutamine amidotransferase